jgi:SOS-response transcriptional repressor LexA
MVAVVEPWIDAAWIRDQLHTTGKTQRALAQALKLDPSAVSRLLEGSRQLKAHEIPRIVAFFQGLQSPGQSVGSGASSSDGGAMGREAKDTFSDRQIDQPDRYRAKPGPRPKAKPTTVLPVLGPLVADRSGFYRLEEGVAEQRLSPPQLLGVPGAYALFVPDDQLAPRYRAGEVIYIHPSRPPTAGSFVVVRFRTPKGRVAIGEVTLFDTKSLGLRVSAGQETLNLAEIGQIGRIVVTSTE